MRHLILLRHAKSSWVNPDLDDFDRPLNKRGKRSAAALGEWLQATDLRPGEILCSSARRTRETCEYLDLGVKPTILDELYQASTETMLSLLRKAEAKTVMMIGHNPGVAELAHLLIGTAPEHPRWGDFPTGSLMIADFDIKKFSKLTPGSGTIRTFLTPHDLGDSAD